MQRIRICRPSPNTFSKAAAANDRSGAAFALGWHSQGSMEHRPPSTAAGSSGSKSSRPASVVPSTTRWKGGGSSFRQPPAYSVSPPRVVKPWQPPLILREAENRTAEVMERQRPSSSSAFVNQVLSSRTQNAKLLEQASLPTRMSAGSVVGGSRLRARVGHLDH